MKPGKHGALDFGEALELEVDVAIVGAGAGGCAAAAALAERGLSVAVFEEGRHWRPWEFPRRNPQVLKHLYQERGARVALGDGMIVVNGGRGVGGSTLINSAISFRTPASIVQRWQQEQGFDPRGDFADLVERVWTTIGVVKNPPEVQGENNLLFLRGARALGLKADFLDRGAPGCTGCGVCQLGCPSGGKNSVDRTFLEHALNSGGVGVYAGCRAQRVETEGSRVVAVSGEQLDPETQQPVGTWRVRARRFLLSGGPVGSPRLMMANGLDDALGSHGHCGSHLHLHPASGMVAAMDQPVRHWKGVSQGAWVDRWEEGYLLQTATCTPDTGFMSLPLPPGPESNEVMAELPRLAMGGVLIHDEDTWARVSSKGIFFRFGDLDRRRILAGQRELARLYLAAGARYCVSSVAGAGKITSPEQVDARLPMDTPFNRILTLASHPMGTCRMARDPADGVVDPRGRVFGWDNLYVADASVFPSSLGVNPQVTVMAIGLMVGREIAED